MSSEPAQSTPEPEGFQLQLITPPEYPPGPYSNFVQATFTPHDFTIYFGSFNLPPVSEQPQEALQVPVRPVVTVSVPLNLVRGLIGVLQSQIANWEGSFGQPFPEPPGLGRPPEQATAEAEPEP